MNAEHESREVAELEEEERKRQAADELARQQSELEAERVRSAEEKRAAEAKRVEEAKKELEARRAVAAWLDVHRLLKRTNAEALELMRQAQKIACKQSSPIPPVPEAQRTRLFALLAEFLDEAAVKFHSLLQKSTGVFFFRGL